MLWVRMPSGANMPVDPVPDEAGNVAAMRDGRGVWVGRVMRKNESDEPYEKRFMPHRATCQRAMGGAREQAIASGAVIDLDARRQGRLW